MGIFGMCFYLFQRVLVLPNKMVFANAVMLKGRARREAERMPDQGSSLEPKMPARESSSFTRISSRDAVASVCPAIQIQSLQMPWARLSASKERNLLAPGIQGTPTSFTHAKTANSQTLRLQLHFSTTLDASLSGHHSISCVESAFEKKKFLL